MIKIFTGYEIMNNHYSGNKVEKINAMLSVNKIEFVLKHEHELEIKNKIKEVIIYVETILDKKYITNYHKLRLIKKKFGVLYE